MTGRNEFLLQSSLRQLRLISTLKKYIASLRVFFNSRKLMYVILGLFILSKLFFLLKPHFIGWDESVYIGMGKYVYSAGTVGLWENIRPIGLPLMLGFAWFIGLPVIFFGEIISIIFAAGSIILTYKIAAQLFDENTGLIAAVIFMITPVFFAESSLIHASIPSAFFVLLAFYLHLKNKAVFSIGICLGIAVLFRFTHGIAFAAFGLMAMISESSAKSKIKKIAILSISFFAVLLPFLIFNNVMYADSATTFDAFFRPFLLGSLHQNNPFNHGNLSYYTKIIFTNPLLVFGIIALSSRKSRKLWIMAGVYLAYFIFIPNKQMRFAIEFLPYISIAAAYGMTVIISSIKKQRFAKYTAVVAIIVILAAPMIENTKTYRYRESAIHPLTTFFTSFNELDGLILTANPMPVAYADAQFLPFYDNPENGLRIFDEHESSASYILYFPEFYPCFDEVCALKKETLEIRIKEHEKIKQQYEEYGYYMYKVDKTEE